MAVLAFIAIFVFHIPFPYIVLMAGIIGYIGSHIAPEYFKAGGHHAESHARYGPALIDDDTPVPDHARFNWGRIVLYALAGLALGSGEFVLWPYITYRSGLGTYEYDSARPHVVSRVGERDYAYDGSGRLIGEARQVLSFEKIPEPNNAFSFFNR